MSDEVNEFELAFQEACLHQLPAARFDELWTQNQIACWRQLQQANAQISKQARQLEGQGAYIASLEQQLAEQDQQLEKLDNAPIASSQPQRLEPQAGTPVPPADNATTVSTP